MRFLFLFLIATSTTFADKWLALSTGCSGIVRPKDQNPVYQIEYQPNPLVKPCDWSRKTNSKKSIVRSPCSEQPDMNDHKKSQ
jgi:hypothetical protein